ncbi:uncharacterized protein LOC129755674 [Uranotaenia lowii]|uniref:uncharacterized protein LOC129755674 n=1 Tax=Uranotaenia lowii TaxID=190385 RepID=UPI002479D584|nr:uncharacterized protein LOC129755674 [Uranotaenia lowii]
MEDSIEKAIEFIKTTLIPGMVERGELKLDDEVSNAADSVQLESLEVKPLKSDGFSLAVPYKAKVTLASSNAKDRTREYQLVIKITPPCSEEMYATCQFDTLFENELLAYTEIIPALGKADLFPRCFYSHRKPLEAVMVLSDFSVDGWKMSPMIVNLPLEYCLLAARELGRFHGECYGLKENHPDKFQSIISRFKEARYGAEVVDMGWNTVMKVAADRAIDAVRKSTEFGGVPETYLEQLHKLLHDSWSLQRKCVVAREPLAVICHGDYLRNNMAFQFEDHQNPENPTKVMMFDFQTLRYASPMIDFAVFIANSTGCDVRNSHFDTIFKTYHNELVNTLAFSLNIGSKDLPSHYSYESFLREYARYSIFGLAIAASFLMILHEPIDSFMEMESWPEEKTIADTLTRGGAKLDREFAALIYEMYTLQTKLGIQLDEIF